MGCSTYQHVHPVSAPLTQSNLFCFFLQGRVCAPGPTAGLHAPVVQLHMFVWLAHSWAGLLRVKIRSLSWLWGNKIKLRPFLCGLAALDSFRLYSAHGPSSGHLSLPTGASPLPRHRPKPPPPPPQWATEQEKASPPREVESGEAAPRLRAPPTAARYPRLRWPWQIPPRLLLLLTLLLNAAAAAARMVFRRSPTPPGCSSSTARRPIHRQGREGGRDAHACAEDVLVTFLWQTPWVFAEMTMRIEKRMVGGNATTTHWVHGRHIYLLVQTKQTQSR
jgi:hypothetical protein